MSASQSFSTYLRAHVRRKVTQARLSIEKILSAQYEVLTKIEPEGVAPRVTLLPLYLGKGQNIACLPGQSSDFTDMIARLQYLGILIDKYRSLPQIGSLAFAGGCPCSRGMRLPLLGLVI
jgi:hypothetical protein